MSDRLPLEVFLTGSGALNGSRTLEDKYLSAQLSAVEMVRKGCTAACDLFVEYPVPSTEGVDAVARAYRDVGMRAVIAPMMADHTLYQAYLPRARRSAVRGAARDRAPRGHRALDCSDEFLVGCRDLAREYAVGLQTHLAESAAQAAIARQRYGTSLTARANSGSSTNASARAVDRAGGRSSG